MLVTLKKEVIASSETLVNTYKTIWSHNSEGHYLYLCDDMILMIIYIDTLFSKLL
jgi:hypothetical protein